MVKFKPFIAQKTPIKTHFHFFADIYFYHDEDSGETDESKCPNFTFGNQDPDIYLSFAHKLFAKYPQNTVMNCRESIIFVLLQLTVKQKPSQIQMICYHPLKNWKNMRIQKTSLTGRQIFCFALK